MWDDADWGGSLLWADECVHGTEVWNRFREAISLLKSLWTLNQASFCLSGYLFDWINFEDFAFLVLSQIKSSTKVLAWMHEATQILYRLTAAVLLSTFHKLSSCANELLRLEQGVHFLLLMYWNVGIKLQCYFLSGWHFAQFFLTVVAARHQVLEDG